MIVDMINIDVLFIILKWISQRKY